MTTALLSLHVIEPLHIGDGLSLGDVDLPVRRERMTGWPVIEGPGLKGALKDTFGVIRPGAFPSDRAFGADDASAVAELVVQDARLLLLPVRSLQETWLWLSCPMALNRWVRDLCGRPIGAAPSCPSSWLDPIADHELMVPAGSIEPDGAGLVVIEGLALSLRESDLVAPWVEWLSPIFPDEDQWTRERFGSRFGIVADEMFSALARLATSTVTRNAVLYETRTVKDGALFRQERVLPESVFAGLVLDDATRTSRGDLLELLIGSFPTALSIGGDTSTGHGVVASTLRRLR